MCVWGFFFFSRACETPAVVCYPGQSRGEFLAIQLVKRWQAGNGTRWVEECEENERGSFEKSERKLDHGRCEVQRLPLNFKIKIQKNE